VPLLFDAVMAQPRYREANDGQNVQRWPINLLAAMKSEFSIECDSTQCAAAAQGRAGAI